MLLLFYDCWSTLYPGFICCHGLLSLIHAKWDCAIYKTDTGKYMKTCSHMTFFFFFNWLIDLFLIANFPLRTKHDETWHSYSLSSLSKPQTWPSSQCCTTGAQTWEKGMGTQASHSRAAPEWWWVVGGLQIKTCWPCVCVRGYTVYVHFCLHIKT